MGASTVLIASMNFQSFGDTLITILGQDVAEQATEQKGDIVRIFATDTNATIGYNFFKSQQWVPELGEHNGKVDLTTAQVAALNAALKQQGFTPELVLDLTPKFVIGHIDTFEEHPDSDHLHVAQVTVDQGETLQIVVGAPNAALGQKVVVAKVGAFMPNGAIIWPGELRKVPSFGMMCAARELQLPNAPQRRGILIIPDSVPTGTAFDFAKGAQLVAAQNAQ